MKNLWLPIRFASLLFLLFLVFAGLTELKAQALEDIPLTDVNGKAVKLTGSLSVVIFYCNGCPYSDYYFDRIQSLITQYSSVQFLLVNASPDNFNEKESVAQMKKYASDHKLTVPYIPDKEQLLMKALGATKCPEAVVLTRSGGNYEVAYQGAIDDNPQVANQVSKPYLQLALDAVQQGKAPKTPFPRPQGCVIKKVR